MHIRSTLKAMCLLIALAPFSATAQETIRVSTGKTIQEDVFKKIEDKFTKETGIKLVYVPSEKPSFPHRLKVMLDGKADIAVASMSFDDWAKACKQENVEIPTGITHRVIGKDTVDVITNKATGIKKMTLEQVADVFSGRVKNWKLLGGADLPIKVYMADDKAAGNTTFTRFILKADKPGAEFQTVPTNVEMLTIIDKTPGAVGITTTEKALSNSMTIETPEIGRPATLATRGRPSPAVEKLIAFIRKETGK